MLNNNYVKIMSELINYKYHKKINLFELNRYEFKILDIIKFHVKENSLKFIDLYNECMKNNM